MKQTLARALKERSRLAGRLKRNFQLLNRENSRISGSPRSFDVRAIYAENRELMEKLIFRCHANPYWLYDSDCDAGYGHEDPNNEAVLCGDEPCIYATPDIILRWIKEGKSRDTYWIDGTSCR